MKYCVGIDLGSTTTKAVILGGDGTILGRGITHSRSNYKVACDVALGEALIHARFGLLDAELETLGLDADLRAKALGDLERRFREQQYRAQLIAFAERVRPLAKAGASGSAEGLGLVGSGGSASEDLREPLERILESMDGETAALFAPGAARKSDFFRDLCGSRYLALAEEDSPDGGANFDRLAGMFAKAILEVENLASAAT